MGGGARNSGGDLRAKAIRFRQMRFGECGGEGRLHGHPYPVRRRQPPTALVAREWPPPWELVQQALDLMCEPQKGKTRLSPFELAVIEVMVESTGERSAMDVTEELAEHYERPPTRQDVLRVSALRQRRREGREQ